MKSTPAVLENDKVSNYQKYTVHYKNLQYPLISNHCAKSRRFEPPFTSI